MLSPKGWKDQYRKHLADNSLEFFVENPRRQIFAFQEMAKDTGKPKNDKAIFDSITSLMKAQTYELSVLPERKKDARRSLYHFNLLNVVGTDLFCLDFEADEITVDPVQEETYVASYILDKKHMFSRIHFLAPAVLDEAIERYNKLHAENVSFYKGLSEEFYRNVLTDYDKRQVFSGDFANDLSAVLRRYGPYEPGWPKAKDIWLHWDKSEMHICISLVNPKNGLAGLDEPIIVENTKELLRKHYRYEGEFEFDEMPF